MFCDMSTIGHAAERRVVVLFPRYGVEGGGFEHHTLIYRIDLLHSRAKLMLDDAQST